MSVIAPLNLKPWAGRRVLVTGASGFIGRHVLDIGRQHGIELHSLSSQAFSNAAVPHHVVDLCDGPSLANTLKAVRPDAVIHLASCGVTHGSAAFEEMARINISGTINLFVALDRLAMSGPVAVAGTCYEYAAQPRPIHERDLLDPVSPYSMTKAAASMCLRQYAGRRSIWLLRVFNAYGPGEQVPRLAPYIVDQTRKGEEIQLTRGEQVRDYVFVTDAAESFWRILTVAQSPGLHITNVGTGMGTTLRDFVDTLARTLTQQGLQPRIRYGARPYRDGEPNNFVADTTTLRSTMNWVPSTSIENGLLQTVEALL